MCGDFGDCRARAEHVLCCLILKQLNLTLEIFIGSLCREVGACVARFVFTSTRCPHGITTILYGED